MNDTRFKELLNLHLDHRLSPGEARELERLLQENPSYHRTFRSYALMQRGCAELFRRSALDAPAADALVVALRSAEARMADKSLRRERMLGWSTWGATAGVAAMVALLVARVSQPAVVAEAPPDAHESFATNVVASATALEQALPTVTTRAIAPRQSLPPHLTLAALGIASELVSETSPVGRWQITEEQLARLDSAASQSAAWMNNNPVASSSYWPGSSVPEAQFSGRPISAWSAQSGLQVQSASYTFER